MRECLQEETGARRRLMDGREAATRAVDVIRRDATSWIRMPVMAGGSSHSEDVRGLRLHSRTRSWLDAWPDAGEQPACRNGD